MDYLTIQPMCSYNTAVLLKQKKMFENISHEENTGIVLSFVNHIPIKVY